jgi:hypothetical protein
MEKFFLSYDDPNLKENFSFAKTKIADLNLFETTTGIAESHRACGNQSLTNMFMVIDSDALLLDTFKISQVYDSIVDKNKMYIFSARNPINGLEYGHGAIKIFQKQFFTDREVIDFSTSFFGKIEHVALTLNIHRFNSSPFHTWRTAFRECVKLSAATIKNRNKYDDEYRLTVWCETANGNEFSQECLSGAQAGREYGVKFKDDFDNLKKINNFDFLKEQYVLATRSK